MPAAACRIDKGNVSHRLLCHRSAVCGSYVILPISAEAGLWTHPHPHSAERILNQESHHVWFGIERRLRNKVCAFAFEILLVLEPSVYSVFLLLLIKLVHPPQGIWRGEYVVRCRFLSAESFSPGEKANGTLERCGTWP